MSQSFSSNQHFTRGGQITLHNLRMFVQIIKELFWVAIILFVIISIFAFWHQTSEYERYVFGKYLETSVFAVFNASGTTHFIQPNGIAIEVTYDAMSHAQLVAYIAERVIHKILLSLGIGLLGTLFSILGIIQWLRRRGAKQTEDRLIKGDTIAPVKVTKKLIRKQGVASELALAGLPLIKHTETGHFLFHGTTGSGKSNAIKELLDQIRKRGDRAIIYDKSCNYLEEFFIPGKDILLNPLDKRGQSWDLWRECRDAADFDSLAAAQIPMPPSAQDPFWIHAARTIYSAAAFEMRTEPDKSIKKLLQTLLMADLESVQQYLKGTEAETLVSDKIEKTAISIKSVLATYLKSLKYVKEGSDAFSIRQWIQDDQAHNWLFITSLGDRHETLKPLITAWIDIAVNSLMSLAPSESRRIWLILDELPSLQQLPYFTQTLSESRKFGGCVIVGIQNFAQLAKLYGHDGGREISALLNTRFMFRQPDPEMAKWAATNFGEAIMDEVREGTSYGANTIRDGVSISRVESRKPVVSFSEIMALNNLYAYVRLPGQFPITLVNFTYQPRKRLNIGFTAREGFADESIKDMGHITEVKEDEENEENKGSEKVERTETQGKAIAAKKLEKLKETKKPHEKQFGWLDQSIDI